MTRILPAIFPTVLLLLTLSAPAQIPPVGYLQFEQGFLQASASPPGSALDPPLASQFSINQFFRLSLHPRLMLQFGSQPFAHTSTAQNDPGDLDAGIQGLLTKEEGYLPTIALAWLHRLRAGTAPDLDIGSYSQSATLLVSGDIGDFHYDSNLNFNEQQGPSARHPLSTVRRAQTGQSLAVTHGLLTQPLDNKLEITGELWHFTQPLVTTTRDRIPSLRNHAVATLWTLGFALRPNLILDAGFNRGLTHSSTAWEGFAGATYLLPHRLWPHTAPLQPQHPHRHIYRR